MHPFEIVFWVLLVGSLVVLTIRRIRIKKQENFEDRDN